MTHALLDAADEYLQTAIQLNVNDMFEYMLKDSRAVMSDAEKEAFFSRYIRKMHLETADDGTVTIAIKQ